jgi:hypothetical protein
MSFDEIVSGLDEIVMGDDDDGIDEIVDALAGEDDDIDSLLAGDEIVAGASKSGFANVAAMLKKVGAAKLLPQLARAQKRSLAKKALVSKISLLRGRPALIRQRNPMYNCDVPVSFQSAGTMAPGTSQTIAINSPALWAPYDLFIPSDIAANFAITSLQSGLFTFNPGGAPLKLLQFTEDATSRRQWKLPTVQPGQPMIMVVQNISLGFTGALQGDWWGKLVG